MRDFWFINDPTSEEWTLRDDTTTKVQGAVQKFQLNVKSELEQRAGFIAERVRQRYGLPGDTEIIVHEEATMMPLTADAGRYAVPEAEHTIVARRLVISGMAEEVLMSGAYANQFLAHCHREYNNLVMSGQSKFDDDMAGYLRGSIR